MSETDVWERASFCGYARLGEEVVFALETKRFPLLLRPGVKVFLAASFNGWEEARGGERWRLTPEEDDLLVLRKPRAEMEKLAPFSFKFITEDGAWANPPDEAPNVETSLPGARNFLFLPDGREPELLPPGPDLDAIAARHLPEGWFGVRVEDGETRFRLFAPRATSVALVVGSEPDLSAAASRLLRKNASGAWEAVLPGDLSGNFYHYLVDGDDEAAPGAAFDASAPILDPYAVAALGPAGPGIVRDPRSLRRRDRPAHVSPAREDLVIVDAHLRDLLAKAPADLSASERLTFSGLAKWIRSEDCHLRRLGGNAIELQPVLEPDAETPGEYFWGYMPVNFFAPASHYSTRPAAGSGPDEFRELVDACHDAGLAVILDLVYNHVGLPNHLARIDKALYFATDRLGRLTNHSGCGNDLRAASPAARRLVLDSLKHLLLAFDLDGFRLDLAELLGLPLLREIETELLAIKPGLHLIAEPWSFRGRLPAEINHTTYSLWDDDLREGLLAYVLGQGSAADLLRWLTGRARHPIARPAQLVRYLESHDDYAFIDRLTQNPRRNGARPTALDQRRHRLALALLLLSPGVPMLSSGQDFLRSKKGVRNTYLRGDLNALDYSLLQQPERAAHHAYLAALVALRLSETGKLLRPAETPPPTYYQTFEASDGQAVALLINADQSAGPEKLLLAVNPSPDKTAALPIVPESFGNSTLLATTEQVSPQGFPDDLLRENQNLRLPPTSLALRQVKYPAFPTGFLL